MPIEKLNHSLGRHNIGSMSEAETSTSIFREFASELVCSLIHEGCEAFPLKNAPIEDGATPFETEHFTGKKVTI